VAGGLGRRTRRTTPTNRSKKMLFALVCNDRGKSMMLVDLDERGFV
jgi:hypothetical protein